MSLIYKLEEQLSMGFTGKVNVLEQKNHQFAGEVLFREGAIVGCRHGDFQGAQGLLYLIISDVVSEQELHFVVEPEMISDEGRVINFDYIREKASGIVTDFYSSKKLRPPSNIRLLVQKNFLLSGADIDFQEFQVLCAIVDCATIGEVYNSMEFHEYEVTNGLVSLRKKKAIKVLGREE